MNFIRISELFEKYQAGTASDPEINELMLLLDDAPDSELLKTLYKGWVEQDLNENFFSTELHEKLMAKIKPAEQLELPVQHIGNRKIKRWGRVLSAAVIISIISLTTILLLNNNDKKASEKILKVSEVNDISPGGERAILTLADGRQIILDTASNGNLVQQEGIKIIKENGHLSYNAESSISEVVYNTVSTPKGGQYQLHLADGTKIWLNAASSITFPTTFIGERKVSIVGEAYFEVAHIPSKPFVVSVNGVDVTVLGTHFNINAYSDESYLKTTLVEGKVMVERNGEKVILKPGQQATVESDSAMSGQVKVTNVDTEREVAWMNGLFNFDHSDINKILRELARWYDIEVEYKGKVSKKEFFGIVSRHSSLMSVLKALKVGGPTNLNYTLVGRKLIVQPDISDK